MMDKQEAVNKLIQYINSIEVDEMLYKTRAYRNEVILKIGNQIKVNKLTPPKGIGYQHFEIQEGEPGVFINFAEYLGYYCYDYGFYFRIPTSPENKPTIEIWTPDNEYGVKKRIYDWGAPQNTYDITSLVMKNSQMPFMNWKIPPF